MTPAVELVTTGQELLDGRILNRHAWTLARELDRIGWRVGRDTTVPDDRATIRDAVRDAMARARVVIVTGGLGPTSDDLTRDAVADIVGSSIVLDEPTRQVIRERYARLNRALNPVVELHAQVVERAEVLSNRVGLAPGEWILHGDRTIVLLPGPPSEFLAILRDHVIPRLNSLGWGRVRRRSDLLVCGIGESDLVARLGADFPGDGVDVAYCARLGRVEVRLASESAELLSFAAGRVREAARTDLAGEGGGEMEEVVGRLLAERRLTIATAESCTGGLVSRLLTRVPGSSAYFRGGVVAYANDTKTSVLGVPAPVIEAHGAVSAPVAEAMALGARLVFGAEFAVAVTGVAGPSGGSDSKPVGLVYLAVADTRGVHVVEKRFGGDREWVQEASAVAALDLVRRRLQGVL